MNEIYELCDTSDDEQYFSLGVFETFIAAVNVIAMADKDQDTVSEYANDIETLEIRRRELELPYDVGVKVYECTRESIYHEDEDENYWETVTVWMKKTGESDASSG